MPAAKKAKKAPKSKQTTKQASQLDGFDSIQDDMKSRADNGECMFC